MPGGPGVHIPTVGGSPTTDASLLTSGTIDDARLPSGSNAAAVAAAIYANPRLRLTLSATSAPCASGYARSVIALNSVVENTGPNWSVTGGVATCLVAGVYLLVGCVRSLAGASIIAEIGKNSVTIAQNFTGAAAGSGGGAFPSMMILDFAVNDTLDLAVQSSAAVTFQAATTYLQAVRIG